MHAIRLKNLRSLSDTDWVPLLPLTLLLGQNSSGKSTFLRTLPLLRQSVEVRTSGPILWYGPLVDFGGFTDAVGRNAEEKIVTLQFKTNIPGTTMLQSPRLGSRNNIFLRDQNIVSSISLGENKIDNSTSVCSMMFDFSGHNVVIHFDEGRVSRLVVNATQVKIKADINASSFNTNFLPSLLFEQEMSIDGLPVLARMPRSRDIRSAIIKEVSAFYHHKVVALFALSCLVLRGALSIVFV